MGRLVGHIAPGFSFFLIGLWHLVNHIKLQAARLQSYTSPPWFTTSRLKYSKLLAIMAGCCMSMAMELFIGLSCHQPLDRDWTIPSNHLHNFEHSLISISFFTNAPFAIVLDKTLTGPNAAKAKNGLTQLISAIAFGQQLFVFHPHSADHMGVEGQYHLLLQAVIVVSPATTLVIIALPKSFLVSFVRSASILFVLRGQRGYVFDQVPHGRQQRCTGAAAEIGEVPAAMVLGFVSIGRGKEGFLAKVLEAND